MSGDCRQLLRVALVTDRSVPCLSEQKTRPSRDGVECRVAKVNYLLVT
jgi:hypothetical protein